MNKTRISPLDQLSVREVYRIVNVDYLRRSAFEQLAVEQLSARRTSWSYALRECVKEGRMFCFLYDEEAGWTSSEILLAAASY